MPIYNVIDISSYIINYSNQINHPINNLKLQKLLYYVQAAMLIESSLGNLALLYQKHIVIMKNMVEIIFQIKMGIRP